jgi:glutathione S-transferase
MSLTLYAHPFSSYCQKALIALYENETPFTQRIVEDAAGFAELGALWPLRKFPVLRDGERTVPEATTIIEYLAVHHPGTVSLIPDDKDAAIDVRFTDRVFDNYVETPLQKIVGDSLRNEGERDPRGVADARAQFETIYRWLEERLPTSGWACGSGFTLADCAAAPALFYADWAHPIDPRFKTLRAYRARLLARPSVARAVDEARPYRSFFPLGAPDRD